MNMSFNYITLQASPTINNISSMTTTITKWIILTILMVATTPNTLIHAQDVPCLHFFGDSQFDNGNNNALTTTAKANYRPYGIDYPSAVPTGRFSNGKNIADFLAQFLGFNSSIPPFVTTKGRDILKGLNYASGGTGILENSGIQLGVRINFNLQLVNHLSTVIKTAAIFGNFTAASDYLQKCLYVVNTGSNDYINNYYLPNSPNQLIFTPNDFADRLIVTFNGQLTRLYNLGARKVAVFGVGLLGCILQELALYPPTDGSPCVNVINNAVALFNTKLIGLINQLNSNLTGARFIFINSTNIALGDPSLAGVKVTNASCCQVQPSTGQCVANGAVCSNRDDYFFFDNIHPAQLSNRVTAFRSYNASSPFDAYPYGIRTLART